MFPGLAHDFIGSGNKRRCSDLDAGAMDHRFLWLHKRTKRVADKGDIIFAVPSRAALGQYSPTRAWSALPANRLVGRCRHFSVSDIAVIGALKGLGVWSFVFATF